MNQGSPARIVQRNTPDRTLDALGQSWGVGGGCSTGNTDSMGFHAWNLPDMDSYSRKVQEQGSELEPEKTEGDVEKRLQKKLLLDKIRAGFYTEFKPKEIHCPICRRRTLHYFGVQSKISWECSQAYLHFRP